MKTLLKVHDDVITVPEEIGKMMEEYASQGYQVERLSSMNFKISLVDGWVHIYWQDGRIWQEVEQEALVSKGEDGDGDKKGDDIMGKILRERVYHHLDTLNKKGCPCPASLEAYVSLMELREVANRCGYGDLVGVADRYRVTGLGEAV